MSGSDIGHVFAVATGAPATQDAAGYVALTWVKVEGLISIGAFGDEFAAIGVPDLETGREQTIKGKIAAMIIDLPFREVDGDAGQAAMEAANLSLSGEYSFRITNTKTSKVTYHSGPVMGWQENEKTDTSYAGFSGKIASNFLKVTA